MRKAWVVAVVLAIGPLAAAQNAPSGGLAMSPAIEFPAAGVVLAAPEGFQLQAPDQPMDVMAAVQAGPSGPAMAMTLTVLPVPDPQVDLEVIVRRVREQQAANLAIRRLEVLKSTEMPVAGLKGLALLVSYTFRGQEHFAARVFFLRELPSITHRLCYVLTVEASEASRNQLLPVLGEIIKTTQLVSLTHPSQLPVEPPIARTGDAAGRFVVGVPRGWFVAAAPGGLNLGQMDYLAGQPGRRVALMVRPASTDTSVEELSRRDCQSAAAMGQQAGIQSRVVSQLPTTLAGQEAWQFVVEQMAPTPATATAASLPATATSAPAPQTVVIVQRMTRLRDTSGATLSVAVITSQASPAKALEDMEQLVAHLELPAPVPQTAPATGPAPSAGPAAPASVGRPATAPAVR
jgi:translation elongation factor EF-1beta